ncbi:YciI family protein [Xanthomonas medicagonis]|uniref:YciI family protein n=1 Tax=Xanthomonas medicagonis TaxID=3160841 RepID=UPI0035122C03
MQFLLLIYIDPALLQAVPDAEYDRLMRGCLEHADALQADGTLVLAQQLQPVAHARTLRTRQGQARITDGPFAETRELLAGFNLINARDHDEALRIAAHFPWSRFGSIEVRPLADMDAERARVGASAACPTATA